jgi:hypothetical protein
MARSTARSTRFHQQGRNLSHYAVKHSLLHRTSGCTPNAEMTLDLEVKVLTSLASVTWSTGANQRRKKVLRLNAHGWRCNGQNQTGLGDKVRKGWAQ